MDGKRAGSIIGLDLKYLSISHYVDLYSRSQYISLLQGLNVKLTFALTIADVGPWAARQDVPDIKPTHG